MQYAPLIEAENTGETRTLFFARVAVGDPYYMQEECGDARRPPEREPSVVPGLLYDAILANSGAMRRNGVQQVHQEVVLFDGVRCFPELIIQLRTRN